MYRILLLALIGLISFPIESGSYLRRKNRSISSSTLSTLINDSPVRSATPPVDQLTDPELDKAMAALSATDQRIDHYSSRPREHIEHRRTLQKLSEKLTYALISSNRQELITICSELEPLLKDHS
jgi:hypothetical protein